MQNEVSANQNNTAIAGINIANRSSAEPLNKLSNKRNKRNCPSTEEGLILSEVPVSIDLVLNHVLKSMDELRKRIDDQEKKFKRHVDIIDKMISNK